MHRRHFLRTAAAAPLAAALPCAAAGTTPAGIIDVNVHLDAWPFRHLPDDAPERLAARLRRGGVKQAWAASFDGILHRDLAAVNARVAAECRGHDGLFLPVGTLNPAQPGWREDLRRCVEDHGMKVLRLHPAYHGYGLDHPALAELVGLATAKHCLIQLTAQLEDARTQHPEVQVAPVDFKPLPALLARHPAARIMLLNTNRAMTLTALRGCKVWVDIAMQEGVAGVEVLLTDWPADRVVFGSHAPFFYWESAQLKMQESVLAEDAISAIHRGNAVAALR